MNTGNTVEQYTELTSLVMCTTTGKTLVGKSGKFYLAGWQRPEFIVGAAKRNRKDMKLGPGDRFQVEHKVRIVGVHGVRMEGRLTPQGDIEDQRWGHRQPKSTKSILFQNK